MSRRWWEQAGIDLEGEKKRAAEAMMVSSSESEAGLDVESSEDLVGEEESQGAIGLSVAEWSGADK